MKELVPPKLPCHRSNQVNHRFPKTTTPAVLQDHRAGSLRYLLPSKGVTKERKVVVGDPFQGEYEAEVLNHSATGFACGTKSCKAPAR